MLTGQPGQQRGGRLGRPLPVPGSRRQANLVAYSCLRVPRIVGVSLRRRHDIRIMHHGTNSAKEIRVDELTGALPPEVGIVLGGTLCQMLHVFGKLLWTGKVFHVDVGFFWTHGLVVLRMCTKHNRNHIIPKNI